MSGMQIVSSAGAKKPVDMTESELEITLSDMKEVVEYLTREDASYDERCFAEEVKTTANTYRAELDGRKSSR